VKKLLSLCVFFGLVIGMVAVVGCGDDKKGTTPAADKSKEKDKTPAADKEKKAP